MGQINDPVYRRQVKDRTQKILDFIHIVSWITLVINGTFGLWILILAVIKLCKDRDAGPAEVPVSVLPEAAIPVAASYSEPVSAQSVRASQESAKSQPVATVSVQIPPVETVQSQPVVEQEGKPAFENPQEVAWRRAQ